MSAMIDTYSDTRSIVQRELAAGESLLWSGRPDPVRSSGAAYGCWIFAVPWTAFSVFWMAAAWGLIGGRGNPAMSLFGLPFLLVGLGMMMAPRWAYASAKKTVYAVTTRRLIIMNEGRFRKIKSFYADDLGALERR